MFRKLTPVILIATFAVMLSGCGDNKTKEKLVGASILTSNNSTSGGSVSKVAANSATTVALTGSALATGAAQMGSAFSPGKVPGQPVGDGYYDWSTMGYTIYVRFRYATGQVTIPTWSAAYLDVKISGSYAYGGGSANAFNAVFTVNQTLSPKSLSGTISSVDPMGYDFTGTMSDVQYDVLGNVGIPRAGSMSLSSVAGDYSGAFTFSHDAAGYKCNGTITRQGADVASVFLVYDQVLGKYTGYYIDLSTGQTHTIS